MNFVPQNRIKELRLKSKLSQEELGALMGVTNSVVSHHEAGSRQISDENIWKYAQIFKVATYELFFEPVRKKEMIWDERAQQTMTREKLIAGPSCKLNS